MWQSSAEDLLAVGVTGWEHRKLERDSGVSGLSVARALESQAAFLIPVRTGPFQALPLAVPPPLAAT